MAPMLNPHLADVSCDAFVFDELPTSTVDLDERARDRDLSELDLGESGAIAPGRHRLSGTVPRLSRGPSAEPRRPGGSIWIRFPWSPSSLCGRSSASCGRFSRGGTETGRSAARLASGLSRTLKAVSTLSGSNRSGAFGPLPRRKAPS